MEDFLKRLYARYIAKPAHEDELLREEADRKTHRSEAEIDEALKESFPASDPPAY